MPPAAPAQPGLDVRPPNSTCVASPGWRNQDIGAVTPAGSLSVTGDTWTVRGAGADIWNQADAFHFAYRRLDGDGEVTARVASLSNTDPWAKAGVMVRRSLAADSAFAMMLVTPGAGAAFHYRTADGGNAQPPSSGDGVSSPPRWVRIVRSGDLLRGYHSANGTTWVQRDTVSIDLPAVVHVGIAVSSHDNGTLATSVFDNVRVSGAAGDGASVEAAEAYPGAPPFIQPTKLLQAPGDGSRWYVLEKTGRVRVFPASSPAQASTWLDFRSKVRTASEGGLLGLAFHPAFPATPHVYISYTAPGSSTPMRSVVSRLILDNPAMPASVTEQVLIRVDQPYDNHNGGEIAFGPDGNLYIALGDGGSGGDPQGNGQNTSSLLGSILRINVSNVAWPSPGYTIPPSNPFAGNAKCGPASNAAACPEIFAWGFRNPWRFSFDPATDDLWAADVGQNAREEIDVVVAGGNYGWRCREGDINYATPGCQGGFIEPVFATPHQDGNVSITGGFVYRGQDIPGLTGRYVYGDFSSGRIWALADDQDGGSGYRSELLVDTPSGISTFGVGLDGEIHFADFGAGKLYRLVAAGGGGGGGGVPDDLAATGCVNPADPRQPAPGVIPYSARFPFWSDGAVKERFLALPDGSRIVIGPFGDWTLPPGAVLVKTMQLNGRNIETRLLMRADNGAWSGYTYEWNDAGTAATRVHGGKTKFIDGRYWVYPSEGQCQECHTQAAGFTLGLETRQLNGSILYPTTGRTANQVETLAHIGMFTVPPGDPAGLPALPAGTLDAAHPLDVRARAYLHVNCAGCHQPAGPTPSDMDLRVTTPLAAAATCNAPPQSGDLGIQDARLIAPGDVARSVLLQRMARRDVYAMPPLASTIVDAAGVELVSTWISSLPSNCEDGVGCH